MFPATSPHSPCLEREVYFMIKSYIPVHTYMGSYITVEKGSIIYVHCPSCQTKCDVILLLLSLQKKEFFYAYRIYHENLFLK